MGKSQCLREVAKLFFHKTLSPFLTEKVETTLVIKKISQEFNSYCLIICLSTVCYFQQDERVIS